MEDDNAASARGVAAARADIAAGKLEYRWYGHAGHWGHWIVSELAKRFGVGAGERFGVCLVTDSQMRFDDGYNSALAVEMNRRHGDGAFEAVFEEARRQSEDALGDARRAWLQGHAGT
jgi:hypothetical protein